MKNLLKSFDLSDNSIKVYLEGLGKYPHTFSEIQRLLPDISKEEVEAILEDLIKKKLIMVINPKYSVSVPHYIILPPFSAMLNSISELDESLDTKKASELKNISPLERFQGMLYQDLENISGELIDTLSSQDNSEQTIEILSEVEENVKKFARVILNDVIDLIAPLRMQSAVDARDFSKLINSIEKKITDSEEIATNMFNQFKEIVNEMESPEILLQVKALKNFIKKLGELFEKRFKEFSLGGGEFSLEKIKTLENSLYNLLTDYIELNKASIDKIWVINSVEKVKEIISILLDNCKNDLTIIVPDIDNYIPLDKFDLDYSEDLKQDTRTKKAISKKAVRAGPLISKKQKKEVEERLELASKKVAELKGYELSHDVADVLGLISDVNPESNVIDSIQGWLNRLLVIRKHLDSNTQYLLLEDIEKWKKNYLKQKKKEEKPEQDVVEELQAKIANGKSDENIKSNKLNLIIISSDPHESKYPRAFIKKSNIEYKYLKNNNIIAVKGDKSYLVFGVCQKSNNKTEFEISGFFTTYEPLINIISPLITEKRNVAEFTNEIEINKGFNEIIENINDYPGRKIAKRLKSLLDAVFEKDGISLDILELKLLMGKLKRLYQPLNDDMKDYVINELNKLNKKFSELELIYPPEFRPPILEDKVDSEVEIEIVTPEIESLDSDKIDNLFELILEKIDNLKGVEIVEQIDKFIEVILKLQGFSNIIEWKNTLCTVDKTLEEPFKEKIREDLLNWKVGILNQLPISEKKIIEDSSETDKIPTQDSISSIFEEEYVSPGLSQSQFGPEEESNSHEDLKSLDPKIEMKELFNKIQTQLNELSGTEIGKLMQNIVDIILETEGYSMVLKDVKIWISKLRKIKEPLESEVKDDFQLEFLKWKEKYSDEDYETDSDFSPSSKMIEESNEIGENGVSIALIDQFNELIEKGQTLRGDELSNQLQNIADILLQSHGAAAVNDIRQWISKLRSIKEPLEDDIKDEFVTELENWKEKFS
ncbi:MAG: hypothetical protein JSV62_14625 [Promethearchaeota archaeon]|nr:MAG: hypothetical protein JSV62_14625 [Candidatus Lokiarchaeota archaeon]